LSAKIPLDLFGLLVPKNRREVGNKSIRRVSPFLSPHFSFLLHFSPPVIDPRATPPPSSIHRDWRKHPTKTHHQAEISKPSPFPTVNHHATTPRSRSAQIQTRFQPSTTTPPQNQQRTEERYEEQRTERRAQRRKKKKKNRERKK
jgi:hypothetical protein